MLGQLAACNRLHSIYERCARWLLLTHDRVNSDKIALTHEYLSMMLGSQRSGVTIAACTLQRAGFIRYASGNIVVQDRQGLEEAACECYGIAREQFGPYWDHAPPISSNAPNPRLSAEDFCREKYGCTAFKLGALTHRQHVSISRCVMESIECNASGDRGES